MQGTIFCRPEFSREDSTTALSFATLTVITDHGKRDKALLKRAVRRLPENKQPQPTRPYQGDQG